MIENMLPVLAEQAEVRIVQVDGQPAVTARDLARALGYKNDAAVRVIYHRNKDSFKERGVRSQIDSTLKRDPHSEATFDTGEFQIETPSGNQRIRYFTKRGALKVCMKSNQPKAVRVQEMLIDLFEAVERREMVPVRGLAELVERQAALLEQQAAALDRIARWAQDVDRRLSRLECGCLPAAPAAVKPPVPEEIFNGGRLKHFKIERLGLESLVRSLVAEHRTAEEIVRLIFETRGVNVGKSSVHRYIQGRLRRVK